ncbi:YggS family pyridoxal phosphate-dependent enzyme [Apibacter muscae]|uniref:YggS family pyridoxal phosphate-dependent enzyme n=1 Tax=Apibacter muscae TaxID=2509004 RepID=UPI0011AE106F|nr:YggS family pyridoxal phosphate-dependent enzyme [Apibacter muscae]TWP31289.1 YggS family pyridoxal phosphate-dependent enzyme [Apibacter muscae]
MNESIRLTDTLNTLTENVSLVAVSKTRSIEEIAGMYKAGQKDFGENKVQEMMQKEEALPKDIRWHQIGHLQKNKVKYIAPFVHLIHSVDSEELLHIVEKEAIKNDRILSILLQVKIAQEETKYGLTFNEALQILTQKKLEAFPHVNIIGLMGMASFTDNIQQITEEFLSLNSFFIKHQKEFELQTLSMGMSNDYPIAIQCGSNMVRIGTKLFGARDYNK